MARTVAEHLVDTLAQAGVRPVTASSATASIR